MGPIEFLPKAVSCAGPTGRWRFMAYRGAEGTTGSLDSSKAGAGYYDSPQECSLVDRNYHR
jgi:hypothetical protein